MANNSVKSFGGAKGPGEFGLERRFFRKWTFRHDWVAATKLEKRTELRERRKEMPEGLLEAII